MNLKIFFYFIFALLDPDPLARLNPDPIRIRNPERQATQHACLPRLIGDAD
jgi:hypothetical protein